MTTAGLLTMIITMGIVSAFAGYFFMKILKTPRKSDEGSN